MGTKTKAHRKSKAALAAGAVACTVAATAAYRRNQARRHLGNAPSPFDDRIAGGAAGADGGPGATPTP